MFRLAERDYGLTLRAISSETGIALTTLKGYANGNPFARAKMDVINFVRLCRVLPDDLTSMCLEPANKHVGIDEEGEGDFDVLGREAAGFVAEKLDADADGVITHIEKKRLKDRARRIAARARAVAA
jgi:hypothetical protein